MGKAICICGHFAGGLDRYDGQTIKTREIYDQLVGVYGKENIEILDTHNWHKHPTRLFASCRRVAKSCDNIILIPAHKGVRVFVPLFLRLKKRHSFKLHYIAIGGWISSMVEKNKKLRKDLERIDCIYIENLKTINQLKNLNIKNLYYMPNFKNLKKNTDKKIFTVGDEMKCCIFSRLEEQKGILDAVEVVKKYNASNKKKIVLDIYGEIKDSFSDKFNESILGDQRIKYKGAVAYNKSVEIIKKYDLLLFPTKYWTEGVPGTVIDAYFAGTPVLASKWENFDELIIDGETGVGYGFGSKEDFYEKLNALSKDKKTLQKFSKKCLEMVDKYSPKDAMRILIENIYITGVVDNSKIDFVVLWVDNKDKTWQSAKKKYAKTVSADNDVSEIRYRDWDLLKYWFRGVEQFAPWVNKIHFVTCGHLPKWLDTNNPRLHIVKHSDYMPKDALPTFNSNAIEISAHKIDGLAEQFVLFNDDFYLLKAVKPEDFFKNGKPVNTMALHPILQISPIGMGGIANNNLRIINKYFNFRNAVRKNLGKYLSLKQRKFITKTYPLLVYKYFPGFATFHMPNSYLKSTWEEVWEKEGDVLNDTLHHRFRDYKNDNNHWLFNFWQFASGNFCQRSAKFGIDTNVANPDLPNIIAKRKAKCVNAGDADVEDFEKTREEIVAAFEKILPNKSEFEK